MMFRSAFTFSLTLLALLATAAAAPAQETLRWQFSEGQSFDLLVTQEMNSTTDQDAFQLETTMDSEIYIRWQVESVDSDGTAQVTQTIQRTKMSMSMGGGEPIVLDTDNPDDATGLGAMLAEAIAPIIDQEIRLTVSNRGEILELTLSEEAQAAMEDAGGANPLNEEFMRQSVEGGLLAFPAEALNVGATWNHVMTMPSGGAPIELAVVYTYAGQETKDGHEVAVINIEQSMSIAEGEEEAAFEMSLSESSGKGTAWFDNEAGYLVESEITQSFVMEIEAEGSAMTSTVETESHLTFTPVE